MGDLRTRECEPAIIPENPTVKATYRGAILKGRVGVNGNGVVVKGKHGEGVFVFRVLQAPEVHKSVLRGEAHKCGPLCREDQAAHRVGVADPFLGALL